MPSFFLNSGIPTTKEGLDKVLLRLAESKLWCDIPESVREKELLTMYESIASNLVGVVEQEIAEEDAPAPPTKRPRKKKVQIENNSLSE